MVWQSLAGHVDIVGLIHPFASFLEIEVVVSDIQAIDVHGHYGVYRKPDGHENAFMSGDADIVVRRANAARTRITIVSPLRAILPRHKADRRWKPRGYGRHSPVSGTATMGGGSGHAGDVHPGGECPEAAKLCRDQYPSGGARISDC